LLDEGDGEQPTVPQLMQQLDQQGAEIEQLIKALDDASKQLENETVKEKFKLRIVELQEETKRMIALADVQQKQEATTQANDVKVLQMRTAAVSHRVDVAAAADEQERAAEIQGEQMQAQQAHDSQQLAAQQMHASTESQADRDAAAAQAAAAAAAAAEMPKAA
jgi:hypothetical protein